MRLIKLISLAAIAAIAATAFIGASSASASVKKTVLCKVQENLCKSGNLWGSEVTIVAESTNAVLLGLLAVECDGTATILAEVSDTDRILGKVTGLTWTNCTTCKSVITLTLPSGSLFHTSLNNGKLLTTSETVVDLNSCGIAGNCVAKASDATLSFTGGAIGSTALSEANEVPTTVTGGFFCANSGKWDAGPGTSEPYIVKSVNGAKAGSIFISLESHA